MTKNMTVVELSESFAKRMSVRNSCKAVFKLAYWWFALVYIVTLAAVILIGVPQLAKHDFFLTWFLLVNNIGLLPITVAFIVASRNWQKIHPLYDEALERRTIAKNHSAGEVMDTICVSCGYPLIGEAASSDICPECGKNPEDFQ